MDFMARTGKIPVAVRTPMPQTVTSVEQQAIGQDWTRRARGSQVG